MTIHPVHPATFRYLVCGLGAALALATSPIAAEERAPSAQAKPVERIREGESLRASGTFEMVGDRATFNLFDSEASFRVLENLALQRITQSLNEARTPRKWEVHGIVTEYNGVNYLLITRAVMKSSP